MKYFNITVNGAPYHVTVEETVPGAMNTFPVFAAPPAAATVAPTPEPPKVAGGVPVTAPMPGNILDIKVKKGDKVKSGQALVILEAMKMENEIVAPQDGSVASIQVNKGDTVNSGDVLVTLS